MTLSNKEKNYIKKIVQADSDLDVEIIIRVINKKREKDDLVEIEDIVTYIDEITEGVDKITENVGGLSENEEKSPSSKHQKRAQALKRGKELEEQAAKASYITAEVIDDLQLILNTAFAPKIKKYTILQSKGITHLEQEIEKAMSLGWQPLGGVSAAAFGSSPVGGNKYIQAMVIY